MKKRSRKKNLLTVIIVVILFVIAISNFLTYSIVSNNVSNEKEEEFKEREATRIANEKAKKEKEEKERLEKLKENASFELDIELLKDIDNVMFVAHPDDEALWAGSSMLNKRYLIVCFTGESNPQRSQEFFKTMKKTNNQGLMLDYPDLISDTRIKDEWKDCKESISADIAYILSLKKWKSIVTHNPEGEYGHVQHKSVSFLVTNECITDHMTDQLYYFERYYSAKYIKSKGLQYNLTEKEIQKKMDLIFSDYSAQQAVTTFKHMIPFEELIKYKEWYFPNRQ